MSVFSPRIIRQTTSTIELSWRDIENNEVYKVEQLNKNNQCLALVYWGTKAKCKIEHLDENLCFRFQIHALIFSENAFTSIQSSDVIRANTLPNIPTTVSIYRAIRKSQEYLLKRFISSNSDLINVPGPNGMTPLGNAIVRGSKDMVDILVGAGANINLACPITRRTPLHLATFHGHVQIGKFLIDQKADKNLKDCIGMNFLHYAIDGGHLSAIKLAMDNFSNFEERDSSSWTYLLRAVVMQCSVNVIRILLDYNCNAHAVDKNNLNALDIAKISNQIEVINLLEQHNKILASQQTIKVTSPT